MKETIEQKIRKIQGLFLDQIEIRLTTDTEIDKDGTKYYAFVCDAFCVDSNYHDHDLHFYPESDTDKLDECCSSPLTASSEFNFTDALEKLYNRCLLYIDHGYSVYSDEPMIIAIASSLDVQ